MTYAMYSGFSDRVLRDGWEKTADAAVDYGFSAVEIFDSAEPEKGRGFRIKDVEEAKAAKAILDSRGLPAVCYSVFANVYKSPETVEMLKKHAELAAAIGSPYLHHTLLPWYIPGDDLPEFSEAVEIALDAAEEIARHAEKFGVTCIYEDQGFYANGIEGYRTFYTELKRRCKNVGVCGDMGNSLFVDVPAEEFFAAFAEDIKHVHAKDYLQKKAPECPGEGWLKSYYGTWLYDAKMGCGVVNAEACMKVLKDVGYKGAVAIETGDFRDTMAYLDQYAIY